MQDELPELNSAPFWQIYKIPLIIFGVSVLLLLLGMRIFFSSANQNKIEFSEESTSSARLQPEIKIEVAGAVEKPGVYSVNNEDRIQDVLFKAGGLSASADRVWVAKYINLASRITDGIKIYFPYQNEGNIVQVDQQVKGSSTNTSKSFVNINTASEVELDTLSGVGQATAAKIISARPYQSIDELLSKKIVSKSVFEKIKDKIAVY